MLRIFEDLKARVASAMERAYPAAAAEALLRSGRLDPQLVVASKPEFGDFQANGALALAKPLSQPPRQIAAAIVAQLVADPAFGALCEPPQIAGPGFVNLTLRPELLAAELRERLGDPRLGVPSVALATGSAGKPPVPVVVDFSSPNIAKEMHVGHLRSTIIGDCLARVLEFRGHPVLRLNHVGDWGTQFGMLITHLKQVAPEALTTADAVDLGDLVAFYRQAKARFDADGAFQATAREEVVKLQGGDPVSRRAWQLLCAQSRREFQQLYDRLDIRLSERGESFYNPYLEGVVDDLDAAGLLVTDAGARCVFLEGVSGKDGQPLPLIVQKGDGGFIYATTDLAALRYRFAPPPNGDGAGRIIYVTDAGQASHFAAVFQVARRAGWVPEGGRLEHVPFGLVQGEDGKKLKTRSGDTVRLKDLLDEAVERAGADLRRRLTEEGRHETEDFISHVATTVGIAAVKYADLSANRNTNYQFSFDRMLALQGNTAPYLLYALVRIGGIARRGGEMGAAAAAGESFTSEACPFPDPLQFIEAQEWALARQLLQFDAVIASVEEELLPNRLCTYLFELSQVFNRFYDQVPVLKAEEPARGSRLALCRLSADTLRLGLGLLGIPTLERM
ncbi:arginine--tRNA ligase [Synechococcus sp. Tobar12-5m-g]|uniref:arginine--tRNA ligase n=1 Tax=unclassified Synechococcus TaxID=2626047 RepID=UPI0020CBB0F4|nr:MULTISPECIES: arginine--tRNA ligase [unclassified Synechococcus]MCP9773899.1 arginine--tRNA ligase [Synechococcus sp. Tobar12-5m-g]MCP9874875.1 arginine--tRNA ligase [Synechococcus sp. Cruz CV-v-12]